MAFVMVFLAFERPSRLQWTRLHPLACDDNEPVGSERDESKTRSLSSNDRRVCHRSGGFSKFLVNNRRPDASIVDMVPSRHCALPQPKTENDTIDTLRMCNATGCGIAQVHTQKNYSEDFKAAMVIVSLKVTSSSHVPRPPLRLFGDAV